MKHPTRAAVLAVAGLTALAGCTTTPSQPEAVSSSTAPSVATSSPSTTTALAGHTVTLQRVVDGDTIVVSDPTTTEHSTTVRIIGINTPETVAPGKPVECYGNEAHGALTGRIAVGWPLQLIPDPTQDAKDRYGRTLAYIEDVGNSGAVDIGLYMIQGGYARAYKVSGPAPQRYATYLAAQEVAKANRTGLWGVCPV